MDFRSRCRAPLNTPLAGDDPHLTTSILSNILIFGGSSLSAAGKYLRRAALENAGDEGQYAYVRIPSRLYLIMLGFYYSGPNCHDVMFPILVNQYVRAGKKEKCWRIRLHKGATR